MADGVLVVTAPRPRRTVRAAQLRTRSARPGGRRARGATDRRDCRFTDVKATKAPAPRDYDANKKLTGLKRQAIVDVDGRFLIIRFSTARLHDSLGGAALPKATKLQCPFLELTWADSVYRGPVVEAAPSRGGSKSCPASQDRRDSSCRNAAGSWSATSLGSAAAVCGALRSGPGHGSPQ
jgi:hypothetical protein